MEGGAIETHEGTRGDGGDGGGGRGGCKEWLHRKT